MTMPTTETGEFMARTRLLPLLLFVWPIAEIATFVWVGTRIGVLGTVLLVIASGLIGIALVRAEGLRLLGGMRRELAAGRLPAEAMLHAALLAFAGLLLLLPGFLSDVPGFLLLLPPVRRLAIAAIAANATIVTTAGRRYARDGVVDLDPADWRSEDDDRPPPAPPALGGR